MRTTRQVFTLTSLSLALMSVFGAAQADEDVDRLIKPESTLSVGAGVWSNDRLRLGAYDGMRDSGLYGLLEADIAKRDETTGSWIKFNASNQGKDNREARAEYLRQGNFGGYLEYMRSTYDYPYRINTGLQGIGTSTVTTGTNLGSFARRDVDLGTTRESVGVGGYKHLWPGLTFKLDFKNEDKSGTRHAGWGSAALFSVEPIDSTTRQLEAALHYSRDKLQLSGGYYGSWYDNQHTQLLQRLNGVTGGTSASFNAVTPMSLPLSNEAHQVFFKGGYSFTPTTRGSFKLEYATASQDERLPSYDLTGANAPFINAPSHLNGRVFTTLAQVGLSTRPTSNLSIVSDLRYYDVNDKTPVYGFVGNNATGVATVYNTPHSYTRTSGKLEGTYRLPHNFSVTSGIDYAKHDRSYPQVGTLFVPFRPDVTETTYRAQVRRSFADSLSGSLGFAHSDRDGGAYTPANGTPPYSNEINPVYLADRSRNKWRAALDWEPLEELYLQFRVDYAKDKYPSNGRPYGPQDGSSQLYAIDASYAFSDDWVLTAWYAHDATKARQVGFRQASAGAANAIRDSRFEDSGDSLGINVRGKLTARLEGSLGMDYFANTSRYPQTLTLLGAGTVYPTGAVGPLPDIKNKVLRFKFDAKYALDKSSDLRFDLIFERWNTNDWSWQFANGSPFSYYTGTQNCAGCVGAGYTGVVDGTTVTAKNKQVSTFVGLRYIYRFQ